MKNANIIPFVSVYCAGKRRVNVALLYKYSNMYGEFVIETRLWKNKNVHTNLQS